VAQAAQLDEHGHGLRRQAEAARTGGRIGGGEKEVLEKRRLAGPRIAEDDGATAPVPQSQRECFVERDLAVLLSLESKLPERPQLLLLRLRGVMDHPRPQRNINALQLDRQPHPGGESGDWQIAVGGAQPLQVAGQIGRGGGGGGLFCSRRAGRAGRCRFFPAQPVQAKRADSPFIRRAVDLPRNPAAAGRIVLPQPDLAVAGLRIEPHEAVPVRPVGAVIAGARGDRRESVVSGFGPLLVLVAVEKKTEILPQRPPEVRALLLHQPVRRMMDQSDREIDAFELFPQRPLLPLAGGPEQPPLLRAPARPGRVEAGEADAQAGHLADRGPDRPSRIIQKMAQVAILEEAEIGAEAAHVRPPLPAALVDHLQDAVELLAVQPLRLVLQDLAPVDVVVAWDEEKIPQRDFGRKGVADRVEKRGGLLELLLDRLPRLAAEVAEGGITGEEEKIGPQAVLALQAAEIRDQGLGHPRRIPARARLAGVEVGQVQPGQWRQKRSSDKAVWQEYSVGSAPLRAGGGSLALRCRDNPPICRDTREIRGET